MSFTYRDYENLLCRLNESGYEFSNYKNWKEKEKPVILRHDIDCDIKKALKLAEIEQLGGVESTWFVLITSDFYNIFSKESYDGLQEIMSRGHKIGLHFDEARYPECEGNPEAIKVRIQQEAGILGAAIGCTIDVVSMHRPSKGLLEANIEISGIINSYSQIFFREFKYLSDSRRRWRESVDEIVESGQFDKLHILSHAFWYNEEEVDIHDSVCGFVNEGNQCRYNWLSSNITDLESIMMKDEVI